MKLYRIRDWNELYENNRTRELKRLDWFPMPNKQDGDGYTLIMEHKQGAAIFGAWVACVQIASRCDPRGTLLRDSQKPHDEDSLSRMSRIPVEIIREMLKLLSSNDVNWLNIENLGDLSVIKSHIPAGGCEIPAGGCLEGKGREGKGIEGKEVHADPSFSELETAARKTGKSPLTKPDLQSRACSILAVLNLVTKKDFREVDSNLKLIMQRISEKEVTDEGVVQMIKRQCELWMKDPKMSEYLRPATLFGKEKFDSYYANRNQPITGEKSTPPKQPYYGQGGRI